MNNHSFVTRRSFLCAGVGGALSLAVASLIPHRSLLALGLSGEEQWLSEARAIVSQIRLPKFPARERELGIESLSQSNQARQVIQASIDEFARDGGGTVRIGTGEWSLEGPLRIKSNIRLHLEKGAVLRFSDDPDHYLPPVLTRWEGTEAFNYSPFIYSYQAHNVAITGEGTVSVRSSTPSRWRWRESSNQRELRSSGRSGAPLYKRVHDEDGALAPSLIQFFGCSSVLVEGITTLDAPFWGIHLVYSHDVTVRGVTVKNDRPQNDGIDVDSTERVLIERCVFETGDDCIAIKSGRDLDGRSIGNPSESIVIRDCTMKRGGSAALAIGSEMSGGVRSVYLHDCVIQQIDTALDIKSNLDRGGVVERIRAWKLSIEDAETLFEVTTRYHGYSGGAFVPMIRDVALARISVASTRIGILVRGAAESPVTDLSFHDIRIARCATPSVIANANRIHLSRCFANGASMDLG